MIVGEGISPMDDFVDREKQLRELDDALTRAIQGRGGIILISGREGTGKRKLLEAFFDSAQRGGQNVLVDLVECSTSDPWDDLLHRLEKKAFRCWRHLARHPLIQLLIFRELLAQSFPDWFLDQTAPRRSFIRTLILFLLRWRPKSSADPRLIRLSRLAKFDPLLLGLINLQELTSESLGLLEKVGDLTKERPVLVVGTFRSGDVGPGHPLDAVKGELLSRGLATEIPLDDALQSDEARRAFVEAYLHKHLGLARFPRDFPDRIVQYTGGHPLLTKELIEHIRTQGPPYEALPPIGPDISKRIQGFIKARWNRLDSGDQILLTGAAIEGATFTPKVLARVLNRRTEEVRDRLDQELSQRRGWVRPAGRIPRAPTLMFGYRFENTLYHQFVIRKLSRSPAAFSDWHKKVGQTKEQLWGAYSVNIAPELATHFEEGGIWEKARRYYGVWLEAAPGSKKTDILLKLVDIEKRLGELDAAVDHLGHVIKATRETELKRNLLIERISLLFDLGRFEVSDAFSLIDSEQLSAFQLFVLCVARGILGDVSGAKEAFTRAAVDPHFGEEELSKARQWLRVLDQQGSAWAADFLHELELVEV